MLPIDLVAGAWTAKLAWLNLILGTFNLLPAFPLDGGRVLRSVLERRRDLESATRTATRIGHALAGVLIVLGLLFDVWLVLIGLFVYFGGSAEEAATIVHARLRGHHVRDAMAPGEVDEGALHQVVDADAPLDDDLLARLAAAPGHQLAVQANGRMVGVLRLEAVGQLVGPLDAGPASHSPPRAPAS